MNQLYESTFLNNWRNLSADRIVYDTKCIPFLSFPQQIITNLATESSSHLSSHNFAGESLGTVWLSEMPESCHRLKSRHQQGCVPFWKLWGRIQFQAVQVVGWIRFCVAIGLRSPCPGWLLAGGHSSLLEVFLSSLLVATPSQNQQQLIKHPAHSGSLWLSLLQHLSSAFLLLLCRLETAVCAWGLIWLIGPTQIIQNNLPVFRPLTIMTPAKSLLGCIHSF